MVALLTKLVTMFVCWIETALVTVCNALIFALGLLLAGFSAAMPSIPSAPDLPDSMTQVLGWIAWFFPVGTVVAIIAFMLTAWILWFALSIALRWARAL